MTATRVVASSSTSRTAQSSVRISSTATIPPHGIHIDQLSTDAVIVGNVTIGNSRAGLYFEISSGALIEGNYVAGHGEAGILVISSSGVSVSGNHVTGNVSAILVRQDERCRSGRPECVHQLLVQDNYVDIGEGGHRVDVVVSAGARPVHRGRRPTISRATCMWWLRVIVVRSRSCGPRAPSTGVTGRAGGSTATVTSSGPTALSLPGTLPRRRRSLSTSCSRPWCREGRRPPRRDRYLPDHRCRGWDTCQPWR